MCGVLGLVSNTHTSKDLVVSMTDTLAHRGPDGAGYYLDSKGSKYIGLGHRRLSIIDIGDGGHQPMEVNDLVITYNGEVYNYKEIKQELQQLGHSFKSNSDTEVILASYIEWGSACLAKFRGMFAFCIYDKRKQELLLVRDRLGVKPLFLYQYDGLLMFASELKAFHKHPNFDKTLSEDAIGLYFRYGYVPSPACIFSHVQKVQPGTYIKYDIASNTSTTTTYWSGLDYTKVDHSLSASQVQDEVEQIIQKACNYRMVSDVPVGTFLSGGYDSSLVTAMIQKESTDKINTFTIGFQDSEYDESSHAASVAEYLGTNHTSYKCTVKEAQEIIPNLPYYYDEPFGDCSAIPTSLVSKITAQSVKVALSADGGDELFAGYRRHKRVSRIDGYNSWIPNFLRGPAKLGLAQYAKIQSDPISEIKFEKFSNIIGSASIASLMQVYPQHFSNSYIQKLLGVNISKDPQDTLAKSLEKLEDDFNKVLIYEYMTTLTNDMLVKVDRASMSCHLEGREPLLDHHIYEYMAKVPSSLKTDGTNLKKILKSITHKYLPIEMMSRPKMGFGIPVHDWLRNDMAEYLFDNVNTKSLTKYGILHDKNTMKLVEELVEKDYGKNDLLWLILQFQMWCRQWL